MLLRAGRSVCGSRINLLRHTLLVRGEPPNGQRAANQFRSRCLFAHRRPANSTKKMDRIDERKNVLARGRQYARFCAEAIR